MTLHPLTKSLLSHLGYSSNRDSVSSRRDEAIDKTVRGHLTGRAEYLKGQFPYTRVNQPDFDNAVDRAFQLTPKVCDKCGQEIK